ncbi:MAG: hypothetical protein MJ247_02170 [Alphaproteobacteria bacterium]|nr:hypothetical protein [Alphaproteobacteria bacterium]
MTNTKEKKMLLFLKKACMAIDNLIFNQWQIWTPILAFLMMHILQISSTKPMMLFETDSFEHALRVFDLLKSGIWSENLFMHDNYPYGQYLHFTRITDIFMVLGTLPFLPFFPLKQAVWMGCEGYQIIIGLSSIATLLWIAHNFKFSRYLTLLFIYVFFYQISEPLYYAFHPDHHNLFNLSLILTLGFLFKGFKSQRIIEFEKAGIVAGLGVWISPEGLLSTFVLLFALLLGWVLNTIDIRKIRLFTQYVSLTAIICLIVNPAAQGFFYIDNGRLTLLHPIIFGMATLCFYILERHKALWGKVHFIKSIFYKGIPLLILSSISLGIAYLIFKERLFQHPFNSEINWYWAKGNIELQHIEGLNKIIKIFYFFFIGIIFMTLGLKRTSLLKKNIFLVLTITLIFYIFAGINTIRMSRTGTPFSALAVAFGLLWTKTSYKLFDKKYILIPIKILAGFVIVIFYLGSFIDSIKIYKNMQNIIMQDDEVIKITKQAKGSIITNTTDGPYFAWLSDSFVVASPYHTNAQGIMDTFYLNNSTDEKSIIETLKKRNVSHLALRYPYQESYEVHAWITEQSQYRPLGFAMGLIYGHKSYCFVKRIPMPPTHKQYALFEVNFDLCNETN